MFKKFLMVRKAKKEAAAKAKATYNHLMELNKTKARFLEGEDDPNFIAEIFKGIEGHQNIKVIYIRKNNGTTITIPLKEEEKSVHNKETDWIDFSSLTDSQGVLRIE